jgi:hypothetical protein
MDDIREVDILLPINISQYISIIASILKPSVSNRLLYDEDIKVMIVTSPNSRLDFLVKMGEALFYQLNRWTKRSSIDFGYHR